MSTFDDQMRARARTEDCPMPSGFEQRLEDILEDLPERGAVRRPGKLRRLAVIAAVIAVLGVAGAVASPAILTMAAEIIDQQAIPEEFRALSQQVEPQPFSSAVGASVTDQGYTFTVESIGADDAFITLYCTITGEEPIPLDERGRPELWSLRLKAEGEYLEFWGKDLETELVDAYTLRMVQRCPVLRALPDVVELEVYSDELFYSLPGTWHLALTVDKSEPAAQSLVAEPGTTFRADGHKVTVDKVAVAPSGGGIVLTEAGERPFTHFLLRDDLGNPLPQRRYGTVSRPILPVSNFIAFYGGRTDMTSITIVPWVWAGEDGDPEPGGSQKVKGDLDALPLTDERGEKGYTLLSLEIGAAGAVGVFEVGDAWSAIGYYGYGPDFTLLDSSGEDAELGQTYLDRDYNMETGLWTVTITYPEATEAQVNGIDGVSFWQPNDTIELLEDQAVTVPLT